MTVGGWGEWLKNMRQSGEKPFKMTRENNHEEHIIQEKIVDYLYKRWCVPIDTDVMDGLKFAQTDIARITYINRHKARGYINGQPDIILILPQGKVLLVEVKTPYGRQSDAQKAYQKAVENMGHRYEIWRSVDDAKKFFAKDINIQTTGSGGCPLPHSSPLSKDK